MVYAWYFFARTIIVLCCCRAVVLSNISLCGQVLDKSIIQRQNMGAQVKREISIMKLVRHPYVVQLREVLASSSKIFLVCELITGGELFDKIVEKQVRATNTSYLLVHQYRTTYY